MKVAFNKQQVMSLPVGTHQDEKCPGLVLNVTDSSRRWGIYVSVRNVPTRRSLGAATGPGAMSVEAARREAVRLIGELRNGEQKRKVEAMTLGKLENLYSAQSKSPWLSDAIRLNWSGMRGREIDSITTVELVEEHNKIVKARGPAAARRAILAMRTLFAYASALELTERNPAKKVRLVPEKSRDVYLTEDEIVVLRRVLASMGGDAEDFFLLALLTGLRRSNIAGMRWDWVVAGTVTVPAESSKTGEAITVPLCGEAQAILERRQNGSVFVFPSNASCGHLVEPFYWLVEVRSRMKELGVAKHFTIHDLRRTFATRMTAAGAPLTVVAKALGHKNILTTPVYARADVETVRAYLPT
jgi:integrase